MKKRVLSTILAAVMSVSMLAACGSEAAQTGESTKAPDTKTEETKTETAKPEATETADATKSDEIVTLKWAAVGSGMPANYDAWKENINQYLGEKIGVNIECEIVPWGDWDQRRSVIVNTSGDYDIIFTNMSTFTSDVKMGAFLDLTDMLPTAAPELYSMIPEDYWKAASIDNKIYAVPTYKDSSLTNYMVWDEQLCKDNGIDPASIKATYSDLSPLNDALTTIKDVTGTASLQLDASSGASFIYGEYDNLGAGLVPLGVKFDDKSGTVVNVFEQPEVKKNLELMHKWYTEGIINEDAATLDQTNAYRPFFIAQGWSAAAKTTWGPGMGVDAVAIQFGDTMLTNDTVRGSMNCITSNCKNPEKALAFLQLINTDSKVRDAFYYGLEGDNFEYTADGRVHKNNSDWSMAGYTQATFFNVTITDDTEVNQWDEVRALNESAKPSALLGFTFDTTNVADQVANCNEVWNRYKWELCNGVAEPEAEIAAMNKELDAAGFQDVLAEAQAQVNAFLGK